ncbi:MAG: endonuclease/exonuclease/phosphatase family protein, partial [Acidimicrobiia bacterium]|nr:endonuclease/exonuclease/phosphatase family protein [Acidimicrobiia bacterium]
MTTRLTMITWNVQGHAGVDAAAVAAVLGRARPDVIALQEVQRGQARAIVAALGSPWRLAWGFKHWPVVSRPEGVAVLTRHRLAASEVRVLRPAMPVTSHRRIAVVADVVVDPVSGAGAGAGAGAEPVRVRVASVHLSPEAGADGSRLRELGRVAAAGPAVVLGDLNVPDLGPLRPIVDAHGWLDCWDPAEGQGSTHWAVGPRAGRPPDHRLDYVLAASHLRVERAQVT